MITTVNAPLSNLKATQIDVDTIAIAFNAPVTPNGKFYNPENAEKPASSARIYDKLFVRQWDTYITENKQTIWYTTLKISQGTFKIATAPLINALSGCRHSLESPVSPFGGANDFDISKNGIVFVAKDPNLDPANHTKTDVYYIPLKSFTEERPPTPVIINTGNLKGYSNCPVFSPNAKSIVFTRMKSNVYESDKPRLLLVPDIVDNYNAVEFFETEDSQGGWDLRPEIIIWSSDGMELYVTAEENGRGKLFKLPSSPRYATDLPKPITHDGTVTDVKILPDKKLLISSSSLVDSCVYFLLNPDKPSDIRIVSSVSKAGEIFGLSKNQVDEIWFAGAGDYNVHAWVLKPSSFDHKKRYPLAYLIHGGVSSKHI